MIQSSNRGLKRLCLILSVMLYAGLTGCQTPKTTTEYQTIKLLPDAALVQPCDTSEGDPATNAALAEELTRTREQRDECAAQVKALGDWRAGVE